MVQAAEKNSSERIASAARTLIEGDMADAAEGRFSHTVIVANRTSDEVLERCAFEAAIGSKAGVISLRWGRNAASTPRRANISLLENGLPIEVRDCVLWAGEDEERIVLVPWDRREDCHFAIGPDGLERRAGRPAVMLGEGMSKARARLERTARALCRDQIDPGITILTGAQSA